MAVSSPSHDVSDLCIGKPAVISLPLSATVAAALAVLRSGARPFLALFAPDRSSPERKAFVASVSVADVLCYLCVDRNLADPIAALDRPVSVLLPKDGAVRRVDPETGVFEALDVILDGAQNLVVPLRHRGRKKHLSAAAGSGSGEFCWLTQEDFVRHFLDNIALIAPIAALTVSSLGLIRSDVLSVRLHDPALSAVPLLRRAITDQTSVAVLDDDGHLIGEISPAILASCDETAAAAIATLSAGDLMTYLNCYGSPPEFLTQAVAARLREKGLEGLLELMEETMTSATPSTLTASSSSSSDEEAAAERLVGPRRTRSAGRAGSYGWRSSEDVVACQARSSLVAVVAQAVAYRAGYVWVVDEDGGLVGIVTFADVLSAFRERAAGAGGGY